MLDVQCSMLDVHFLVNPHLKLARGKVSFLIRLAIFLARGAALMKLHYTSMRFRLVGTPNRLNVESNIER